MKRFLPFGFAWPLAFRADSGRWKGNGNQTFCRALQLAARCPRPPAGTFLRHGKDGFMRHGRVRAVLPR